MKLKLPDAESNKRIASAYVEVGKHYRVPDISPKHKALLALALAMFAVYKPVVTSAFIADIEGAPVPAAQPMAPPPPPPVSSVADWGLPAGNA